MRNSTRYAGRLGLIGALVVAALGAAIATAPQKRHAPTAKAVLFKHVAPIFAKNCLKCHQGKNPGHGLRLTNYASIMAGDKLGKVVIPGKPRSSRLATVLHGKPQAMPPTGDLSKAEIATIEGWIKAGAKNK